MTRKTRIGSLFAVLLLLSLLAGCSLLDRWFGSEEAFLGQYITLPEETLPVDNGITWTFTQLPDTSEIRGFMPSDTANLVSFRPDVPGTYEVTVTWIEDDKEKEETYSYEVLVAEDGVTLEEEAPEHLQAYLATQGDTAKPETTETLSRTATGETREYMTKLVNPNQKQEKPKVRKTAAPRKKPTVRKPAVKPAQPNRAELIPKADKTYTIQVSAWPSLEAAQTASFDLLENYGIDNYIQRAFFKDKDEVYYRIRVGNFTSYDEASQYAANIKNLTNLPAWVDFVRQEM